MEFNLKKILLLILVVLSFCYLFLYKAPTLKQSDTCIYRRNRVKVAFMKNHKAASSTVQNILLRYGDTRNLTFTFPMTGNYLTHGVPFSEIALKSTPWHEARAEYDIMCFHTVFNYQTIIRLMGKETKFVTILREPSDLFASLWEYYGFTKQTTYTLEDFSLLEDVVKTNILKSTKLSFFGGNQMLRDLGVPPILLEKPEIVNEKIREVDSVFDLVMIAERFDESVVLLRKLLCLEWSDVTTLKLNSRSEKWVSDSKESSNYKERLSNWLSPDYKLYGHFLGKFESQIKRIYDSPNWRQEFEEDMETYKKEVAAMKKHCIVKEVQDSFQLEDKSLHLYKSNLKGWELRPECKTYGLSELAYIDNLRKKQTQKYLAYTQKPSVKKSGQKPLMEQVSDINKKIKNNRLFPSSRR